MKAKLDAHPLFERVSDEELESDPAAGLLAEGTEEGQKVARNSGSVWRNCYRRIAGTAGRRSEQLASCRKSITTLDM